MVYYPQSAAEETLEAISDKVQEWRKANGKLGFHDE
ncbi:bacteriocin immunity protein [Enterobacter bugandensis]